MSSIGAGVHLRDAEFDFGAGGEKGKIFFALRFGELLGIVQAGEFGGQAGFRPAGGRMAAAATTGPASGPRPASSTPATRVMPGCHSTRSNSKRSENLADIAWFRA